MVHGSINEKQTLLLVDELFDDTLEQDSWLNSYQKPFVKGQQLHFNKVSAIEKLGAKSA